MMHFFNATDVLTNRVNCSGSTLNLTLFWRLVRDLRALLFSLLFLFADSKKEKAQAAAMGGMPGQGLPPGMAGQGSMQDPINALQNLTKAGMAPGMQAQQQMPQGEDSS